MTARLTLWLTSQRSALYSGAALGAALWLVDAAIHIVFKDGLHASTGSLSLFLLLDLGFFVTVGVGIRLIIEGRRRVDDELRKLSRAVEQSPSTVMITDLKGHIEYVNPKFTALTGYTLDEVRGRNSNILSSGETLPEEYTRLWRTIAAGGEWRGEFHNVKKDGDMYWESALISPIRGSNGSITHYLAVKEDITARKAAEAAEREQRLLAEALREIAAVLNSTLDFHEVLNRILTHVGRVVAHDVAAIMLIEDGTTRVVGSHDASGYGRGAWAQHQMTVANTPDLRRVVETRQPHVNSDTLASPDWIVFPQSEWIRSCALMPILGNGHVIGFLELTSVTPGFFKPEDAARLRVFADQVAVAIRNAQLYDSLQEHAARLEARVVERTAQLEQGRAQLKAVLDSISEGVAYWENGETKFANHTLERMLGYAEDDFPARAADVFPVFVGMDADFETFRVDILSSVQGGGTWSKQLTVQRRDRSTFEAELTMTPVIGRDGVIVGTAAVVRDISQERMLQERRERFLTYAAHELRTPLANLMMRLYLLRHQPERIVQHLSVLDSVTSGMAQLVEDLLDILRLGRGPDALELGEIDLLQTIQACIDRCQTDANRRDITVMSDLPDLTLPFPADHQRFTQALIRLITYAIYSTPQGGMVHVEMAVKAHVNPPEVVICVCDGGDPIGAADRDQIFEPFFHASEGDRTGLGLGLSLVREIIQLHRGEIGVEERPGCGTAISVRLRTERVAEISV